MKGGDGKSYELVSCAIDGFVNPFCPWPMPMLEPGLEKPDLGHTQRNGLDPILDSVDISGHGIIAKAKQQAPIGDGGKKKMAQTSPPPPSQEAAAGKPWQSYTAEDLKRAVFGRKDSASPSTPSLHQNPSPYFLMLQVLSLSLFFCYCV